MTGDKGNSEFCFHETLNVEVEWKQNLLFPLWLVIECFVISRLKIKKKKNSEKNDLLDAIAYTGCARKIERLPKPNCPIEKRKQQHNSLFLRS